MKTGLTDISVKRFVYPENGQITYWDETTPGFGLRCSSKSKSFVVMYGPKRRLKTLGRYPTLGLAAARKEAKRFLFEFEILPNTQKLQSISFREAKKSFLADCKARNKERTVNDYTRLLNRHFNFKSSLHEIKRQHLMKIISTLSATPSEQNHAFVAIRTMLNWCVTQGLLETSPLPKLSFKTRSRDRILDEEELAAVFKQAREFEYPFGPIIQLMLFTGQRRSEIAALRRSWIKDECINFPEGFTKNKHAHRVPLSKTALKLIGSLPDTGDLLFPSRIDNGKPFNGWGKCKRRFDNPKDQDPIVNTPYTLHDLRRTFSSNMAQLGTPIHVTEKLLNHVSGSLGGVAAVYNRYSYMDEMRNAVEEHDNYLCGLF